MIVGYILIIYECCLWSVDAITHEEAEYGMPMTLQSNLQCDRPIYYWSIKDPYQQLRNNEKYTGTDSSVLTIRDTNFNDTLDYRLGCYVSREWRTEDFSLVVVGRPVILTPGNYQYKVATGKSILLPCFLHQSINPKVTFLKWEKIGTRYTTPDNNKYFGGNLHNSSLTIYNVNRNDIGEYRCTAGNAKGRSSINVSLLVGDLPEVKIPERQYYTTRHTPTILPCLISSADNVIWYRKDIYNKYFRINISSPSYGGGTVNNPGLRINNVIAQDDGTYTCSATNDYGSRSAMTRLTSGDPPDIAMQDEYYGQVRNKVIIPCLSYDAIGFKWYRITDQRESLIQESTKYSVGSLPNATLTIQNLVEDDAGVYLCRCSNRYGNSTASTALTIGEITKATIPVKRYVGKVGGDVQMECLFSGNVTSLTWFKGLYPIQRSIRYSGGIKDNPTLVIKNLAKNDRYNYTCKIKNSFGSSEATVILKVLAVTVFRRSPTRITANSTLHLSCKVDGSSRMIWRQNGEQIRTVNKSRDDLKIPNITRDHAGNYTCETTLDDVTATSSSIHVLVQDYPLLTSPQYLIQTQPGKDLHLHCNHETYPEPIIMYWMKDGIKIDQDRLKHKYNISNILKPNLFILNSDLSDIGTYVCCVRNDIGTRCSRDIQVIVKDAEQISLTGSVVGGVIGLLLAVVIALLVVFIKRNRQKHLPKTRNTGGHRERSLNVQFIPGENDDSVYANIKSSPDTDDETANEAASSTLMKTEANLDDASYYNISDIITTIKVSDLRSYVQRQQKNEILQKQYKDIPYGAQYPTTMAEMKENKPKNRFKTTFPYDHTRVVLESSSDYINANYIDGFEKEKCYIASQGPLKHTINDHWRMIWQHNTRRIVMLTNLIEAGKDKCNMYWPNGGQKMKCGDFVLTLLSEKERAAYVTREIGVENTKTSEKREVVQYHFTAWPDHGTPDPLYLVLFHKHVISDQQNENDGPMIVHCSAGIGRTGTYIGLDALYEEGTITQCVDVVKYVKKMRYSRMNMVQTQEQYACLHMALLEMFTMKDTLLSKGEFEKVWSEIKTDKRPRNQQRLNEEFKMLQEKMAEHQPFNYSVAQNSENIKKNRSANVLASDNTRLFLTSFGKGRTDYINAVQAPSYTKFVGYLSTQLPLPDTMVDFWTMIFDHNSSTIVLLLNNQKEAEMVYASSSDNLLCGPFSIKTTRSRSEENSIDVKTVVLSRKDDKAKQLEIFQAVFQDRPDPVVLCGLVNLISTRINMSNDPVTVVSSDGAKCCGLFCTFVNAVSSMTIDENADIFQLARLLKIRRPEFFKDFEEYRLCYEAVNQYLESSNVYANY